MTRPQSTKRLLILLMASLLFAGGTSHADIAGDAFPSHQDPTPSKQTMPRAYQAGDWQLQRHAKLNEIARRGETDLVFLGDSITQGWENAGKEVWTRYYSRRHAANFGMSSDHAQHVLWRIEQGNLETIHPKAVILMIGTNNAYAGDTAEEIAEGVQAVVHKIREKVPDSKILLLGIFPSGENSDSAPRMRALAANAIFQNIADGKTIRYLDIGNKFVNPDGTISKGIMPDFLHLSPRGYTLWAEAIEPIVRDLMGEK